MPRPPKKVKRQAHRPLIEIDWEKVDKLLMCQCNGVDIAATLGIHSDTLYDRVEQEKGVSFSTYAAQKKGHGDNLLRSKQVETALKGNVTMQIWLGKQRLNQREPDTAQNKDLTVEDIKANQDKILAQLKEYQDKIASKDLTTASKAE